MRRPALFLFAISTAALTSGCVVAVGNRGYSSPNTSAREVSSVRFDALVAQSRNLTLGSSRAQALANVPADLTTLVSARRENETNLEIYQISAYEKRSNADFTRWLYFVNDSLVEVSPTRVNWEEDPNRQIAWFGREVIPAPTPATTTELAPSTPVNPE